MATISIKKMTPANWIAFAVIVAVILGLAGMARAFAAEAEVSANGVTASPSASTSPSVSPSMSASTTPSPSVSVSPSASADAATGGTAGGGTAGGGKTGGTAGGSTGGTTTTTTTTTTTAPPPPPPFQPWETTTYYEGDASSLCAKLDAARQAAGALPFSSCSRGGSMVAHAQEMAAADSVWDGGGSNISGADTSITRVVNAFMASPSHRNQIVGDGSAAAALVGCYWSDTSGQTADQTPYNFKTVFCAAQFDY